MQKNPEFEKACYQHAFLYSIRYLATIDSAYNRLVKGVDNSILNFMGMNTTFHKIEKKETIFAENGGFLVKGALYYKKMEGEEVVGRIR